MTSDKCGCKYLETKPENVAKFTDKTKVVEAIRKIPVFYNENMFVKVIELGVLLPPVKESEKILRESVSSYSMDMRETEAKNAKSLYDTMIAIEASHALLIRKKLYSEGSDTIENLAKLTLSAKEGAAYWEKELLNSLLSDEEFTTSLKAWENTTSIVRMIELFHLPAEKIKAIGSRVLNDNMGKNTLHGNNALLCLNIGKALGIEINPLAYQQIADGFMKFANGIECERDRHAWVENAYEIYVFLKENHGFSDADRDKIIEECKNYRKQNAIKIASVSLKFKYKPRGFEKLYMLG